MIPRNPDSWTRKTDKVNATDVTMADGTPRRIVVPNLWTACTIELNWKNTDARMRNALMKNLNGGNLATILMDGNLPAVVMKAYLDTPEWSVDSETYDTRTGQGGVRQTLKLTGRTDGPYLYSSNTVASTTAPPSAAQVLASFGGPSGSYAIDGLPTWNGNAWNAAPASTSSPYTMTVTNMGTAPWSPTIRVNGPFSTLSLNVSYQDVDGSGQGVTMTWTGGALAAGSYLLFDTRRMRVYTVVGGVQTEVYSFTVTAPGSSGQPFPYWPPAPSGNFSMTTTFTGSAAGFGIDFSNGATNQFCYW